MDSKYELRKIGIKSCTYQYFVDIIKIKDADFDNILIDEKSYENVLVYNILCKTLIGAKQLCISFYKVHGFIRAYDRIYQYFVDIIKIKDADFHNNLIDEKSYENVLVYNILCKTLIGANNCVLVFIKCMDSLELMIELDV